MHSAIRPARWSVVLESPDANALAAFYARLLGWRLRSEETGWVTLADPDGPTYLAFNTSPEYRRPTWPPVDGEQQMMLHLDFCVGEGLEALLPAVDDAVAAGATIAAFQPQEDVRVMLDPDGHPFCLYVDEAVA